MTIMDNKSEIMPTAPVEKTSPKLSTSLVSLVINLPTGVLSKKRTDKDVT